MWTGPDLFADGFGLFTTRRSTDMAKDIPMKTAFSEEDMVNVRRFLRMLGSNPMQFLRRCYYFFEDAHWDELLRYEERRCRAKPAPKHTQIRNVTSEQNGTTA